jgi:hypothetical protein
VLKRPPPLISYSVLPFAIQMPIPNATEATAATEKVRDYLLNLEHPDGGPRRHGSSRSDTPAIVGMNWQAISWPLLPHASNSLPSGRHSA